MQVIAVKLQVDDVIVITENNKQANVFICSFSPTMSDVVLWVNEGVIVLAEESENKTTI